MKVFKIPILKSSLCYFLQICVFHQALAFNLLEHEKNNIEVYNKVAPSVVLIKITGTQPFRENGARKIKHRYSEATGMVWDNQGHIITNFHVLASSLQGEYETTIRVSFKDNNDPFPLLYPATYIGGDPINDIAVLKLNVYPIPLKPITLGNSADLQVGQEVFTIGHPIRFRWFMAKGIISGIGNYPYMNTNLIYTDTVIAPGSSGGALINTAGEIIGMATGALQLPNRSNDEFSSTTIFSMSFATPINPIRAIVEFILAHNPSSAPFQ